MGVGHTDNEAAQHFDPEKHIFFLCSGRDSNLWSWNPLDLEADALPIEPSLSLVNNHELECFVTDCDQRCPHAW